MTNHTPGTDLPHASAVDELLAEINQHVPRGIDWTRGAVEYMTNLFRNSVDAEAERIFHLTKPFVGGPDYDEFYVVMFAFLGVMKRLALPPGSRILDVACGQGWVSHYCGKMGHAVVGVDICDDLLQLAHERLATDPYPPCAGQPFTVSFLRHDVERDPLPAGPPFDACLMFSALHHFLDPVAALAHTRASMKADGLVAIVEGAAPLRGTVWDASNQKIMRETHTLERPYTKDQVGRILRAAGLPFFKFFCPTGGLVDVDADETAALLRRVVANEEHNYVLASPTEAGLRRVCTVWDDPVTFLEGAYAEERTADGQRFRWCQPRCHVSVQPGVRASLVLTNWLLPAGRRQRVYVEHLGQVVATAELGPGQRRVVRLHEKYGGEILRLTSDFAVSPSWSGGADRRFVSFVALGYDGDV